MFWSVFAFGLVVGLAEGASVGLTRAVTGDLCDSQIYCQGDLLKTIQLKEVYNDSKSYVDKPQINDPEVTLSNFYILMNETNNDPNRTQLVTFMSENFSNEDELEEWSPPDWQENPAILAKIKDPNFRTWAEELNVIWRTLARKVKTEVAEHPQRHSLIYVKNGFVIPGGRFTEFYYWDSYWIMEGLLICGMNVTVEGMLENFLSMVEKYGFIPNGGRIYYLMRSQPPLLIPMVDRYLDFTNNITFLEANIETLEREFGFWQRERTIEVVKNGKSYKLAHHIVSSEGPRPESYREDYNNGLKVAPDHLSTFYEDLKAAAESGWDFSGRWFISKNGSRGNITDISTRTIIPVELNAFLQRNARLLGKFQALLGNTAKAAYYENIAKEYQIGIDNVLWNEEEGIWLDYDISHELQRNNFYPSNLAPLYTLSYNISKASEYAESAVNYLNKEGILEFLGGTPTSLDQTGEQWDFPNAWPPLQSIVVQGLHRTGSELAISTAKALAIRWLRANYAGYTEYGEMFEKYDAVEPGQFGGGGEYTVQAGFGWTNGVVFEFLDLFSSSATSQDEIISISENTTSCSDSADR